MDSQEIINQVIAAVGQHVRASKGFEEESWINPLAPVDCVAAFAMAHALTEAQQFDRLVAIAPEGHVYGYFFERLGNSMLSVHVDYPPRRCEVLDDLSVIRGKRVLILEDDVASGTTLRHVIGALKRYRPRSIDLYLGRPKDSQVLEFVDPTIGTIYLAEDHLNPDRRSKYEDQFITFFSQK